MSVSTSFSGSIRPTQAMTGSAASSVSGANRSGSTPLPITEIFRGSAP